MNSGLVGPLLICKPNTLDRFFGRQLNIQEFSLLFMVFDETKSWYMEENIDRFSINGYVAETLPGLVMAQHHLVRWHLLNLGSEGEVHTIHFHGQPFTVRTDQEHRMGVYSLYPGTFGTVEMRPGKVGSWLVDCMIGEYQLSGMRAQFLVYTPKCAQPLGMASGRIADSQITSSPPYGENSRLTDYKLSSLCEDILTELYGRSCQALMLLLLLFSEGDWLPRLARLDMSGSVNAWSGQSSKSWIQVDLLRPMLIHGISTQGAKQRFSDYFIAQFQISYSTDQESWKRYRGNVTHSEKANNPHEWLKVDFGEVKRITGIITQGAKRLMMPMFVTEFTISFSNDGVTWTAILEKQVPRVQVFQGNTDYNTEALNTFQPPIFSRYIRIHPKGWQNEIALRVEFLGCDTQQ
ncbi:Coagulation factor VIII [Acipenser ruthenus]|uniref:Coagulation factor VIII n=1 Tax=Acipenser ruthenus TaxID=7906 RepID=A0A662YQE4_ACIRT|nr:Coagulation factor VIII [Acipenser ruthenus]